MIITLTEDKLDEVKELLDEFLSFLEQEYKFKQSDALNLIENNIKDENNTYYVYIENSTPLGLVGGRKTRYLQSEVNLRIFISEKVTDETTEINLFKAIFRELSTKYSSIRIMGYQPSKNLQKILNDWNFKHLDRFYMSIPRKVVENLLDPELPDGYHFDTWNDDLKNVGIEIITDAHIGSLDNMIFSFFRNQATGIAFMKNLEGHQWGEFKSINSGILKHENKPIGVCFMTVLKQGNGYIPDFAVKQDYKGKGLGKNLFIKSLKWFLKKEPTSEAIDLDVTKKNTIALNIYKKTGFTIQRSYSVYTWNKNQSNIQ